MTTTIRAYMRASTDEQDAKRAKGGLQAFAKEHGAKVHAWYAENESGASLKRPELFRLLEDSEAGDVLLLEQVDRLSRLNDEDWQQLRTIIKAKGVVIVAKDLPTSWRLLSEGDRGDFMGRMLGAINEMLLDMLAAIARKDYEDRRRRQDEGIAKAKAAGKYRGRVVNEERHKAIREALEKGMGWQWIQEHMRCSRGTIAVVAKAMKVAQPEA